MNRNAGDRRAVKNEEPRLVASHWGSHNGGSAMRSLVTIAVLATLMLAAAVPVLAQAPRQDVLWARTTSTAPVLDGVLNESAWAKAESVRVYFRRENGIPGSGWKIEAGILPSDSTNATLKFLVSGNQLYMGAVVRDKSIGGSKDFNRFDGFLMALKDRGDPGAPKPPSEYMYTWWYAETTDPQPPGQLPNFWGRWANWPPGSPRTPEQIAAWDAVTVVHGTSNSDTVNDTDYTVEMRFDLGVMGYNVAQPQGDVVEFNISIYDCDWNWPFIPQMSAYRSWWQGPWGNASWYNEVRIYAKPSVTVNTTTLPVIGPEVRVLSGANYAAPTIDGVLNEAVWASIPGFDVRYADDALRATYPAVGPYRSGQWQPTVNGGVAPVVDPGDATVKFFHRDNNLYLAFDVRDQVVQYHSDPLRWDGFYVLLNDVLLRHEDHNLLGRRLSFQVAQNGTASPQDYLLTLVGLGKAAVALTLKPGTTVDTLGTNFDTGYYAEMRVDLTALSYPPGLGDRTLFIGINHLDGDSFEVPSDSYATHTWWFREREHQCCPAWAYMDPNAMVGVGEDSPPPPRGLLIVSADPNPFRSRTAIQYALGVPGQVSLEVYDIQGRLVERRALGVRDVGTHSVTLSGEGRAAGVYHYRLLATDLETGAVVSSAFGRVVHLK